MLSAGTVLAGPQGGQVTAGQGNISRPDANTTNINQQSHRMSVDWTSFNIRQHELVQFNQPSRSASALNRIYDQNPTQIHGALRANGQVVLVNPNGVFFKPTARVNVGSLIASGLNIDRDDFMAGKFDFQALAGEDGGMVVNQGTIQAATGGSVNLIGGAVSNEGVIMAHAGQVNLAAGRKVTMDFDGDGLMQFAVDEGVLRNAHDLDSTVSNSGEIHADGGSVLLTGRAARDVFSNVVNNEGIVRAGRIENEGGTIRLVAGDAGNSIINTGTLDASGQGGDGGSVELFAGDQAIVSGAGRIDVSSSGGKGGEAHVLGEKTGLMDLASIDASGSLGGGEVLIGGDFQGKNPEIKNATVTYVGADTSINADATDDGDGGKVIVWADNTARVYGDISARGGANGGDGGFIETSGKKYLDFGGEIDASAPKGKAGTWLLDPEDIEITSADANITQSGTGDPGPVVFDPTADDVTTTIDVANINTALDNGSNVTINTASGGTTTTGTITVTSAISKTADGGSADGSTLTLNADDGIIVNNTITSTTGILNVNLNAIGDLDINAAITTNGGGFTSSGANFDNTGGTITTNGGAVDLTGHAGAITVGAAIDASGADTGVVTTGGTALTLNADITGQAAASTTAIDLMTGNTGAFTAGGGTLNTASGDVLLGVDDDNASTGGFNLVQDALDSLGTINGDTTVNVADGSYVEDLTITTDNLTLSGAGAGSSIIEGAATQTGFPDTTSSTNVDLQANNVTLDGFTFRSPVADASINEYSSGIVLSGTGITIQNNTFEIRQTELSGAGSFNGNTSVAIQTVAAVNDAGSDVDGLTIQNNDFTFSSDVGAGNGYYGIYINPQGASVDSAVTIQNNTMSGRIWRGITTERSDTFISGNTIETDTLNTAGDNSGIRVINFTSGADGNAVNDVTIQRNTVGSDGTADNGFGFAIGLGGGTAGESFTNLTVQNNFISGDNEIGIDVNRSAGAITISDNDLSGFDADIGNSITNDGGADLDASGNWWGTASGSNILASFGGADGIDFSPFLNVGTDTDLVTAGFQGDFSQLTVTSLGPQTGIDDKITEGLNLLTGATTVDIDLSAAAGGSDFNISYDGTNYTFTQDASNPFGGAVADTDIGSITVNGNAGDDSLTIDYSGSDPGDITYHGGGQATVAGDSLLLTGGAGMPGGTHTYTFTGGDADGHNGTIDLNGASTVTFTGLEPITNNGTATDIIFNLPNGASNPDAQLQNDTGTAGNTEFVGSTFEDTSFANPGNSLTINLGDSGDLLTLDSVDAGWDASITVDDPSGASGSDTVTLAGLFNTTDMITGGGALTGLSITAEDIVFAAAGGTATAGDGSVGTTGAQAYDGAVTLNQDTYLEAGSVQFTGTVDALTADTELLDVAVSGAADFGAAVGGTTSLGSFTVAAGGQVDLDSVTTDGAIDVTGLNIDLNGTSYTTNTGDITFTGPVDLHNDISFDTTPTAAGEGDILFAGTVDGGTGAQQDDLTVLEAGTLRFAGAVGGGTALGAISITGSAAATGNVDVDGNVIARSLTAVTDIGYFNASGFDIDTTGPDDMAGGNVQITTSAQLTSNNITTSGGTDASDNSGRDAGNITLDSGGFISFGDLTARGSDATTGTNTRGAGGTVTITSAATMNMLGSIDTRAGSGSGAIAGGDITFIRSSGNGMRLGSLSEQILSGGGTVDFSDVSLYASGSSAGLTVDTTTGDARNEGDVILGNADGGSPRLAFLDITTDEGNGTAGTLTFDSTAAGTISIEINDGDFTFAGGDIILTQSTIIDTNPDDTAASGAIDLGSSRIYASEDGAPSLTLSLETISGDSTGGGITLGAVDDGGGVAPLEHLLSLSADASGSTLANDGTVTLNGDIQVDGGGSVSLTGDVRLPATRIIDTNANNSGASGGITLAGFGVSATAAGVDLELDTQSGDAAAGNVNIGAFSNTGTSYVNDLLIEALGNPTSGNLTLNGNVALDHDGGSDAGSFTLNGGGDVIVGTASVTIATGESGTNPGGPIGLGTSNIYATGADRTLILDASGDGTTEAGEANDITFGVVDNGAGQYLGTFRALTDGTGVVHLDNNITIDHTGGTGDVTLAGLVEQGAATVTLDSDGVDDDAAAGDIDLSGATVFADTGITAAALNLNAEETGSQAAGGAVALGDFSNNGENYLRSLAINTTGSMAGNTTMHGDIRLSDNGTGTPSSLSFTGNGFVVVSDTLTIDLSTTTDALVAGSINFGISPVSADSAGFDLTIDLSHDAADDASDDGNDGGSITGLGGVHSNGGGFYLDTFTLDMGVADPNDTAGTLSFSGSIHHVLVDGTAVSQSDAGIAITGNLIMPSGSLNFWTNPGNTAGRNSYAVDLSGAVLNGGGTLIVDTSGGNNADSAGNVTLGAVGATTPVGGVTVDTRGSTAGTLTLSGNISIDGGGNVDFSAAPVAVIGDQILIDSDDDNSGTAGNVLFDLAGSIDGTGIGNESLTIDTSAGTDGVVTLGTVGGGIALGGLDVTADTGVITLGGNIDTSINGAAEADGAVVFGSIVELTQNTTVTTDGGLYDSSGAETVSDSGGPWTLSINTSDGTGSSAGNVDLGLFGNDGGSGGRVYVGSLSVDTGDGDDTPGILTLNNDIFVDGGNVDFSAAPDVDIAAGGELNIDTEVAAGAAGDVLFAQAGTIDGSGAGNESLTIDVTAGTNGNVALGTVGGGVALGGLSVTADAGVITLGGNIATTAAGTAAAAGDVVFGSTVVLTQDTTVTTGGGDYNTANADHAANGGDQWDLSVTTTGSGTAGDIFLADFNSSGGGFINRVTLDATDTTPGDLHLSGAVALDHDGAEAADFSFAGGEVIVDAVASIDTEDGDAANGGAVDLGSSTISPSAAGLTFDINTGSSGNAGGTVTFGRVDNTNTGDYLNVFTVDAVGTIGDPTTFGEINISDDILVDNDGTATPGTIALNGILNISNSVTTDISFSTEQTIIAGIGGGSINIAPGITTATGADINLELDTSTGAAGESGGAISLGLVSANLGIGGGPDHINDLTLSTTGPGGSGDINLRNSIFLDNGGDPGDFIVNSTGSVNINPFTGNTLTIDTEDGGVSAAGLVNFGGTVIDSATSAGDFGLTIDASGTSNGDIVLNDVGQTRALRDLSVTGGTITLAGNVDTTDAGGGAGNQDYSGAVIAASDLSLTATGGGAVAFSDTVNASDTAALSDYDTLAINADTGMVTFGGAVGGTYALGSLTVDGDGGIHINGGSIDTDDAGGDSGAQTYNDAVTVGADTTLTATGGGSITFNAAVDASDTTGTSDYDTLGVNADTGGATFSGAVGSTYALGSLTVDAAAGIDLDGGVVVTNDAGGDSGAQIYNDAVALGATASLTTTGAGGITFAGTLDGDSDFTENLTLTAGTGSIDFQDGVGTGTDLGDVDIVSANNVTTDANGFFANSFLQQAGSGTTDFNGAVTADGGKIDVTANSIIVDGVLTTTDTGGTGQLIISGGGVTLNASPSVGDFNIELNGGGDDLIIAANITDDQTVSLSARRDVIVRNGVTVDTTAGGTADINLTADDEMTPDGDGGVILEGTATVNAGQNAILEGSDVNGTNSTIAGSLSDESVFLDAGSTTQAAGAVTIRSGNNAPDAAGQAGVAVNGDVVSTGGGTVTIRGDDDVTFAGTGSVISNGGNVIIAGDDNASNGGDVLMTDGATVDSSAGTIDIDAGGTIRISGLSSANNTGSAVNIASASGAIEDAGDTNDDITLSDASGILTLTGPAGIGVSGGNGALEVIASTIDATNSTSGGIAIDSLGGTSAGTGAVNFNDIQVNGGAGAITLTAATDTTLSNLDTNNGAIDAVVDDANLTAVDVATGSNNQIDLETTTGGTIALGTVNAGSGTVNVTSVDNITDNDSDGLVNVTGGTVNFMAGTGIGATNTNDQIEVDAGTVTAVNTTSGGIFLNSVSGALVDYNSIDAQTAGNVELVADAAATLTDVDAADGSIDVDADGLLTITSVDSSNTDDGTNTIDLSTTAGNISVTNINAGSSNNVILDAAGSVVNNTSSITGALVDITAGTDIGASGDTINTTAGSLDLTATGGDIFVSEFDGVTINNVDANDEFNFTAGGNVIDNGAPTVSVGGLATLNAGANDITLDDGTVNFGSLNVTGGTVVIGEDSATTLAGASVTSLDLTSGGSVDQTGAVTGNIGVTAPGSVDLSDNSNQIGTAAVDTSGAAAGAGGVTLRDQDGLTIGTVGTVSGITASINSAIDVRADADGSGTGLLTVSNDITAAGTGTIDLDGIGVTVAVSTADTTVSAADGDITINARTGALTLEDTATFTGLVTTTGSGNIFVTADDIVIQNNNANPQLDSGNNLTLAPFTAGNTIALGDDAVGGSDFELNDAEMDALNFAGILTIGDGNSGAVLLDRSTDNAFTAGTGDLTIVTNSTIDADTTGGESFESAGTLTLTANGAIGSINDLELDVASVVVTGTGGNNVSLSDSASNTVGDTTYDITTGGDAAVTITQANDNLLLDQIHAGTTGGSVNLTATAGAIAEAAADAGAVDITANALTATAGTGIGDGDAIETSGVASMDLSVTGTGSIAIDNDTAVDLTDVDTNNGAVSITADGAITATDVQSLTDAEANDISLTSTTAGIDVVLIDAGTTDGDVTLDAQNGAITDSSGGGTGVTADALTADAATTITVDTEVNSLDLGSTGAIVVTELDNVTLTSVDAGTSSVDIDTAGGSIDVAGTVTADTSVDLTAAGGGSSITDTGGTGLVQTAVATLVADTDIGVIAGNPVTTDVDNLDLTATNGDVYINEADAVTLDAVSGDEVVIANDPASSGDIAIDGAITAATSVEIVADGAIVDANAANSTADIVAPVVSLTASGGGIGVSGNGDIDTDTDTLAASATGGIDIRDVGDGVAIGSHAGLLATVTGVTNTGSLNGVEITAESPLTVNEAVSDSAGGSIVLAAEGGGAGDDLTLNANVTASGGSGNIDLYAGDAILMAAGTAVDAAGAGVVSLLAGTSYADGTPATGSNAGAITMDTTASVSSAGGNVFLRAPDSVTIGGIGTAGNVEISADYDGVAGGGQSDNIGAIMEAAATDAAVNISAAAVTLNAATGIGATGANDSIDVTADTVDAINTTSGGIFLNLTGDAGAGFVTLGTVDAQTAGPVEVLSAGDIRVGSVTSTGAVSINTSGGSIQDDLDSEQVETDLTGTSVTLTADTGIGDGATDRDLEIDSPSITLSAGNGGVSGGIDVNDVSGATVTLDLTAFDDITYTSSNDILVTQITSTNTDTITLFTDGGSINDAQNDTSVDITGGTVTLTARDEIGGGEGGTLHGGGDNVLEVTSTSLLAESTGNVDGNEEIDIADVGGTTLTNLDTTASGGNINVTSDSSLDVVTVNAGIGNVTLDATGAITDTGGGSQVTGADVSLTAGTGIGDTGGNPINTAADTLVLNTATGGIHVDEDDAVTLNGVAVTTNGDIDISAGGDMDTSNTISGAGNIFLAADGAASDIIISNTITGTGLAGNTLRLRADNSIFFDSGADVATTNSLDVILNGDRDGDSAGAVWLGDGGGDATVIDSQGGIIVLGGGAGDPAVTGSAFGSGANNEGINLDNAQLLAGGGNITLRGSGEQDDGNTDGILLQNGSVIEAAAGDISLLGSGGNDGGRGVRITGAGTRVTSTAAGTIDIEGNAGDSNAGDNAGVQVDGGAVVNSTGAGGGSVTITGTGGDGNGASDIGVLIRGAGSMVTSLDGAIAIDGTGGSGGTTTGNDTGVKIDTSGTVSSTGTATIDVTGVGGNSFANNRGVDLDAATVTSVSGDITITGTGGGTNLSNFGVQVSSSSVVESTGAAGIAILGTGAGTGAAGNEDIFVGFGNNTIGGGSAAGDILLNGSVNGILMGFGAAVDSVNVQTTGNVTINSALGVTQDDTASLSAAGLRLLGSGVFDLDNTGNTITTLAGNITGATGSLDFAATGGFDIGSVNSDSDGDFVNDGPTNGLTVGTVGTAANTVTLTSGGSVTQSQAIVTNGLELLGAGSDYVLNNTGNNVAILASTGTDGVAYTDAGDVEIGTVNATNGISTQNGGNIAVDTVAGGINVTQAVSADTTGTVTLAADGGDIINIATGTVDTGSGLITLTAQGDVTLDGTVGASTTGAIAIIADDDTSGAGTLTNNAAVGSGAAGQVDLAGAAIVLNADVTSSSRINGTATGTSITRTAGTLTAPDLLLQAQTHIGASGTEIITDVDRIEALSGQGGASGGIFVDETDGITVGGVDGGFAGLASDTDSDGNIALTAGDTITVTEAVNADGAGTVTLDSAADIVTTAAIDSGTGAISLTAQTDTTLGDTVSTGGDIDILFAQSGAGGILNVNADVSGDEVVINGGAGADTLNFNANVSGTTSVAAAGAGDADVFNFLSGNVGGTVSGGADDDEFVLDGGTVDNIDGTAGNDTLDFSELGGPLSITLTGLDTDGFTGNDGPDNINNTFTNIDIIVGTGGGDTLTGRDQSAVWNITGVDSGDYTDNGNTLDYVDIASLAGGSLDDQFNIDGGDQSGSVSGGGGIDVLTGGDDFEVTGANTGNVGEIAGGWNTIENLTGTAGPDTFTFTGGSLSGTASGLGDADVFDFNGGTANLIDGGLGNDSLDVAGAASSATITLTGTGTQDGFTGTASTGVTGSFDNINDLALGGGNDTLVGDIDAGGTFNLNSQTGGSYVSTNTLTFSGVENKTGGDGPDTFNINANHGGNLLGGDGDDTFNFNNGTLSSDLGAGEGSDTYTFNGGNATGTIDIVGDDIWNHAAGVSLGNAITGDGSLTVPDGDGGDLVVGPGDLNLPNLQNFTGHLIVGGTISPTTLPLNGDTDLTVNTDRLSLESDIETGNGGDVTLLGSNIDLDADITAGEAGANGGQINLVALGDTNGGSGPGDITGLAEPTTITGSGALMIAQGNITNAFNINVELGGGTLEIATGAGTTPQFGFLDVTQEFGGTAATRAFLSNINLQNATFVQAQVLFLANLVGIEQIVSVDVGLFEEDLSLFGVIGKGLALALAQCEELEGCAPDITEEELDELISQLEGRVAELQRRIEETSGSELARLEELLAGYQRELQNFRKYRVELEEFYTAEDDLEGDAFADEFTEEGPGDEFTGEDAAASEIQRLNTIMETVNRRIEWLESLKDDPEARERLGELTGMDVTVELLDAIIEATRQQVMSLQRQIQQLLDGREADAGTNFRAEVRDYNDIYNVMYGPALPAANDDLLTLNERWY